MNRNLIENKIRNLLKEDKVKIIFTGREFGYFIFDIEGHDIQFEENQKKLCGIFTIKVNLINRKIYTYNYLINQTITYDKLTEKWKNIYKRKRIK
jgi:hypothetical protein